jgi:hypothetical protein
MLSGIRREKEAPDGLDIDETSTDSAQYEDGKSKNWKELGLK